MSTPRGRGRSARQPGAGEAIAGAARGLWAFRTELALLVVFPLTVWAGLTWLLLGCPDDRHMRAAVCSPAGHAAAVHAGLITLGAIAMLLAIPRVRRMIGTAFGRARLRRHLHRAFAQLDVPALRERRIWLRRAVRTRAGWLVTVILPGGACVDDLERNTERLAAALGLRSVTVTRHPGNAAWVRIRLDRLDPLATGLPFAWPAVNAETMSLWEPVPVAVDEHGETIALSLIEKNLLLGGEPGGGKSTILGLLTAAGALDVEVRLHLFDGKQVELAAWSRLAATVVGPDPHAAAEALAGLRSVMDERYSELLRLGRRKITRGDGLPLHLVVIDELALFMNTGDRKLDGEISNHLRDLVSRGRAAGIIVLAATQKPSSDVIPTHIRDLFSMRWALRCAAPHPKPPTPSSAKAGPPPDTAPPPWTPANAASASCSTKAEPPPAAAGFTCPTPTSPPSRTAPRTYHAAITTATSPTSPTLPLPHERHRQGQRHPVSNDPDRLGHGFRAWGQRGGAAGTHQRLGRTGSG